MKTTLAVSLLLLPLLLFLADGVGAAENREAETFARVYALMREEFGTGPSRPYELSVHMVPMRDGVRLRTRVWIPRNVDSPRAAVLDRTPYGAAYTAMSMLWTIDDYAIVMQDQRGTSGSQGDFEMWRLDGQDGYDTMEWISQQEWSNGMVFGFGVSADANSVYPQILYEPPWLKGHFPVFGLDNGHKLCYPQGAYRQDLIERWLDGLCNECIDEVIENEADGPFWDTLNMTSHHDHVNFPSVHWGGWWDIFLQGQIEAFNGYRRDGSRPDRTYLLIDPHGHCYDVVYVSGISVLALRIGREMFREVAYDEHSDFLDSLKPINFWVFGPQDDLLGPGNYYTSLDEFPDYEPTSYYFLEDGTLDGRPSTSNATISWTSDPNDPVETYGGHNLYGTCGPLDQSEIEARSDVVVFTTEELARDTAIAGEIKAVLYVSSDGNDTDFMVKLTDVYPDGRSLLVTEGVIRMRWRESNMTPVLMESGVVYEVTVELWNTAIIFARGHRIRVDVSSSNFARWSNNPQNGNWLKDGGPIMVLNNRLHLESGRASHIILPVVEESQIPKFTY